VDRDLVPWFGQGTLVELEGLFLLSMSVRHCLPRAEQAPLELSR
jgi:hypothetical protein